ncbi:Protein f37c4.5 [Clonorchis sinensis]|uniref:Protein f37c4.5 n=1 Tax=Clonorchis sinensis TaxID=79923 RepID=A0A8T1M9T1_CLOSI|nr:Protein f37c4.5 [Clonorchis sinensis]
MSTAISVVDEAKILHKFERKSTFFIFQPGPVVTLEVSPYEDKDDSDRNEGHPAAVKFRMDAAQQAYIQDVSYHTSQPDRHEQEVHERRQAVTRQLIKSNRKMQTLNTRFQRLLKQQCVLDSFADSLIAKKVTSHTADESNTHEDVRHGRERSKRRVWRSRSLSRKRKMQKELEGTMQFGDLSHIEAMRNFFTLYNNQTQQLDEDVNVVSEALEQCRVEIEDLEAQLDQLSICHDLVSSKELHVLLESKSSESPTLELSYSVERATWNPCYDIRLSSSSATLQITYYGLVSQTTGEDWEPDKLTLSTVHPSRTARWRIPELKEERLTFKDEESHSRRAGVRRRVGIDKACRKLKSRSLNCETYDESHVQPIDEAAVYLTESVCCNTGIRPVCLLPSQGQSDPVAARKDQSKPIIPRKWLGTSAETDIIYELEKSRNQTLMDLHRSDPRCTTSAKEEHHIADSTQTPENLTLSRYNFMMGHENDSGPNAMTCSSLPPGIHFPSLTYEVNNKPLCIRGNGEPQRVTLGTLEFRPSLEYVTIPKLLPKAFLRVRMHNTSEFALLEGPASVYLDNSFNGKTTISATAVQEELFCDLGVDPGVHVTYKPRHKYKKSGSFIGGGKTMSITFTQVISVTNSYPRSLQITVIDQLPVSTDDKLKPNNGVKLSTI